MEDLDTMLEKNGVSNDDKKLFKAMLYTGLLVLADPTEEQKNKFFEQLEAGLERLEKLDHYLPKWEEQLKKSCVNSKGMVLNDIQFLMRERK